MKESERGAFFRASRSRAVSSLFNELPTPQSSFCTGIPGINTKTAKAHVGASERWDAGTRGVEKRIASINNLYVTRSVVFRLRHRRRDAKVVPVDQVCRDFATQLQTATKLAWGYLPRRGASAGHCTGRDSLEVCKGTSFVRPCRLTEERPRK